MAILLLEKLRYDCMMIIERMLCRIVGNIGEV